MKSRSVAIGFATLLIILMGANAAQSLTGTNTVFSDDIVNGTIVTEDLALGSITGNRLRDSAVTTAKIKDGTIKRSDLSGQVISADELNGQWVTSTVDPDNGSVFEGIAECPTGFELLSGGGTIDNSSGLIALDTSAPVTRNGSFPLDPSVNTPRAWKMVWQVDGGNVNPEFMHVWAYCIDSGS